MHTRIQGEISENGEDFWKPGTGDETPPIGKVKVNNSHQKALSQRISIEPMSYFK